MLSEKAMDRMSSIDLPLLGKAQHTKTGADCCYAGNESREQSLTENT
eukprot:IDg4610t1